MTKKRILIVEDEAVSAMDLESLLVKFGYEVAAVVMSGEKAIRASAELLPDLILMDIMLDGPMNGIEAAEAIRKTVRIPVVFVTAQDDMATIQKAKAAEPYGYVTKPYNAIALQCTIEIALSKSHTDARLQESENHYRALVEGVPGIVYSFSTKRGGVYYSPQVKNMLGYSPEELYARPMLWNNSIHPDDLLRIEQVILATVPDKPFNTEYRIRDAHGNWRWFDDCSFGYEKDGTDVIIKGFATDITDRKRAEEALNEKNEEMERFAYTVSHDLKSPLITFKTYLAYLEQDMVKADQERIKQDLNFMRSSAEKMENLLAGILKLSRIGRIENPPVRATFCELLDEAMAAVAGQIAQKKVSLQVHENDVSLYGDRMRLAEIWQNLIDNAIKYTGRQQESRIELGAEGKGPDTVFFVRDNGMGIDPRHKDRVFGLFDQLDPKSEGSGLGLALVKRIVELYQGRIWVESEGIGRGACFKFTLPGAVKQ